MIFFCVHIYSGPPLSDQAALYAYTNEQTVLPDTSLLLEELRRHLTGIADKSETHLEENAALLDAV